MYQKGMIEWGTELDTSEEGDYCDIEGAYLPHSCNSWVIGDIERIKMLIEDLQKLLEGKA